VKQRLASVADLFTGLLRLSRFRLEKKSQKLSMGVFVERAANRWPDHTMIVTERQTLTWSQFNQRANQFAHFLTQQGVGPGDSVALLMENDPELLAALVGVCKLGATAGLINSGLRGESLKHCISTVGGRTVIFGSTSSSAVAVVRDELIDCDLHYFATGAGADKLSDTGFSETQVRADSQLASNPAQTREVSFTDPAYYIFTSGTTGLPKAAVVTHYHWYKASSAFSKLLLGLEPDDRMYVCLPLFHTAAMLCGFGASVMAGSSFYLARKFSASNFWEEVRASNSNVFLYIGELCRYLLNAPQQASDGDNPLTSCVGNGLQPELWSVFQERFQIRKVAEYYGSTEGNLAFMNILNRERTFGMGLGRFRVVRYEQKRGEIVRNPKGFCIQAQMDEVGLLLCEISEKNPFNGYTDRAATNEKVLKDVFTVGDSYLNTGDLIKRADVGFSFRTPHYQFSDRVGDAFRWKGENVSASEVSEIISGIPGVQQSSVYGVSIPNTEGRAGMVALVVDQDEFDIDSFAEALAERVPAYAQPVFVRIENSLETTDTSQDKKLYFK